ncbi:hypothetical protein HDE_10934 [Halotydeus destructor]|nr:hypothetical protein HDE_10934 [Halotydeus destructor]
MERETDGVLNEVVDQLKDWALTDSDEASVSQVPETVVRQEGQSDEDVYKGLIAKGEDLEKDREFRRAAATYELAIALNPDDYYAHYKRGKAMHMSEEYVEADVSYLTSLGLPRGNNTSIKNLLRENREMALKKMKGCDTSLAASLSKLSSLQVALDTYDNLNAGTSAGSDETDRDKEGKQDDFGGRMLHKRSSLSRSNSKVRSKAGSRRGSDSSDDPGDDQRNGQPNRYRGRTPGRRDSRNSQPRTEYQPSSRQNGHDYNNGRSSVAAGRAPRPHQYNPAPRQYGYDTEPAGSSRAGRATGANQYRHDTSQRRPQRSRHVSASRSVYDSDNESVVSTVSRFGRAPGRDQYQLKDRDRRKPVNIFEHTGIFVGNLYQGIDERAVEQAFRDFGEIVKVQVHMYGAASVYFNNTDAPREAILAYHGRVERGLSAGSKPLFLRFKRGHNQQARHDRIWSSNECYHWRTTGCDEEVRRCHFEHLPMCRGIDFNPAMVRYRRY